MSYVSGNVPPGWYPDPSGTGRQRWWDGQQWTTHFAPAASAFPVTPAPQPAAAQPTYGQPAYGQPASYGPVVPPRPQLAPGTRIYTVFIWLVVALPFVTTALLPFWNPFGGLEITQYADGYRSFGNPFALLGPMYFVILGVSFLAYGLSVLFAWLDFRELEKVGVVRPFHWAWSFLGSIVYVIGRSVIVRRVAPGRGLTPIWVTVGLYVLSLLVGVVWTVTLLNTLLHLASTFGSTGA
ncbi:DUF2510 domain-containing protein [Leifsonia poae]|uniref:DUF2510 domain-containing protein n=1 Tax=Leifsonia poae TaxID=110933 RepID=UPI001CBBA362|nr:DUF2510 domain-containing protein [Leifsonia poae]